MNKAIPVVAIVLLALVAALLIWKFSQSTPVGPTAGNGSNITDVEFKSEDFIPAFDSNGDGHVTLDEFRQRYGKPLAEGEAPFVLYHPQTKKALTAEEAFKKHWDRNSDGVIDARDMELGKDNAWLAFFKKASDAGLTPVRIGDNFYALNEDQNRTMEAEAGAKARKEVPFAGHFWDAKYFQSWAKVYDPKAGETEGFVSEANGRLYLLSSDAALTVISSGSGAPGRGRADTIPLGAELLPERSIADTRSQWVTAGRGSSISRRPCSDWMLVNPADPGFVKYRVA